VATSTRPALRQGGWVRPAPGVRHERLGPSQAALTSDLFSHLIAGAGQRAAQAAEALVPSRRRSRVAPTDAPTTSFEAFGAFVLTKKKQVRGGAHQRGAPSGTRTPNPLIKSLIVDFPDTPEQIWRVVFEHDWFGGRIDDSGIGPSGDG
jgi:hypothetical protein